jgi:acetyl-CoA acetyltransferase
MDRDVGIVGIGEPAARRERTESLEELVHQAARDALDDAGVDRQDVDNLVVCASDLEDGRAISSMVAACPAGGYRKDFIKTTDTGVHALGLSAMRMATGLFDSTLVVSWAKQSETNEDQIRQLEADPMYRRGTGLGHLTGHALTASTYAAAAPDAGAAANAVVERNTNNAAANERGLPEAGTTRETAADSPLVSSPLREAHLPEPSDGATAVLLAADDTARSADGDPVWLEGLGWEVDGYDLSTQTAGELAALSGAAARAYEEAGIDDPRAALDAAEIHEQSAYHELLALESLGLAEEHAAPAAVLEGAFGDDGAVAVNPSGGPFAANPLVATGLARVAAGARQIRAGEADRVAATATAGFTDQSHGVAVLGGDAT